MSRRGPYRSVYASLVDDPDYQQLSPPARHCLLTMRLSKEAGPACIWRYYPETIARQTGLTIEQVTAALQELVHAGWIALDSHVLWIINGLRYDPTVSVIHAKHRIAIGKALDSLPRGSEITSRFCDYYEITKPSYQNGHSLSIPSAPLGSPIPNTEVPIPIPTQGVVPSIPTNGHPPLDGKSLERHRRDIQDQIYNEHPDWSARKVEDETLAEMERRGLFGPVPAEHKPEDPPF